MTLLEHYSATVLYTSCLVLHFETARCSYSQFVFYYTICGVFRTVIRISSINTSLVITNWIHSHTWINVNVVLYSLIILPTHNWMTFCANIELENSASVYLDLNFKPSFELIKYVLFLTNLILRYLIRTLKSSHTDRLQTPKMLLYAFNWDKNSTKYALQ